jgi:hypothetical protein
MVNFKKIVNVNQFINHFNNNFYGYEISLTLVDGTEKVGQIVELTHNYITLIEKNKCKKTVCFTSLYDNLIVKKIDVLKWETEFYFVNF